MTEANASSFSGSCTLNLNIRMSTPTGVEADGCRLDSVEVAEIASGDAACVARFHAATGL